MGKMTPVTWSSIALDVVLLGWLAGRARSKFQNDRRFRVARSLRQWLILDHDFFAVSGQSSRQPLRCQPLVEYRNDLAVNQTGKRVPIYFVRRFSWLRLEGSGSASNPTRSGAIALMS